MEFPWTPEGQSDLLWALMEPIEAPEDQGLHGLDGLFADHEPLFGSATAQVHHHLINIYPKNEIRMNDDDPHAAMLLQLLKEPRDEGDLDRWLLGDLHSSPANSSPSQETNVNHQMEGMQSSPGETCGFPTRKRGTRKKRLSPWNPLFFERKRSASVSRVCTPARVSMVCTPRKNNSHWTQEEVELLVQGISEYGVGKWTEVKGKYFRRSIRTSVNLKDKWRNLLKAYDVNYFTSKSKKRVQKTTLLHLEEPLIKQIKELAEKH